MTPKGEIGGWVMVWSKGLNNDSGIHLGDVKRRRRSYKCIYMVLEVVGRQGSIGGRYIVRGKGAGGEGGQ